MATVCGWANLHHKPGHTTQVWTDRRKETINRFSSISTRFTSKEKWKSFLKLTSSARFRGAELTYILSGHVR